MNETMCYSTTHRLLFLLPLALAATDSYQRQAIAAPPAAPRIVNIINFIRLLEPRSEEITEQVLYETVVTQAELMKKHGLPGTFLLQYDALMDERYQKLLKSLPGDQFEVGAWWELPQPLVEKAGLKWRGRFPWDWHANVGFASGYTPSEREKLVDMYMADFHSIFGNYPQSVASWFIDAHTLKYMHDKYGIVASANCKDQVGTDGYTLWGGYWNQAYYPSQRNAYMPAQTESNQIPVPIFRMLGSDPLRQYDTGIGHTHQGVTTLEPVYHDSGGDPNWVEWFLDNFVEGECLAFNYAQAGQENSFTWKAMGRGLEYQFPRIAELRRQGKLRVETLADSGRWFRQQFPTTPATAMTFQSALRGDTRQAFWFNSRFYRTSLSWEEGKLRIRDIHLFDETVESPILQSKIDENVVEFYTLPVVDGFYWSSQQQLAGLRFKAAVDGTPVDIVGVQPTVSQPTPGELKITWSLQSIRGELIVTCTEDAMTITASDVSHPWWLELITADDATLPFTEVSANRIAATFKGFDYAVQMQTGSAARSKNAIALRPAAHTIAIRFDQNEQGRAELDPPRVE